jgi:hypothetical protein
VAAETWNNTDHLELAVVDNDATAIVEDAVRKLGILRSPMGHGDALLRLHALATLIAAAQAQLPDAIADARDQDHPWPDIAAQLGVTTSTARRRYNHTTGARLSAD